MNYKNKCFMVFVLFAAFFATNIFGIYQQESWVSAKTNTKYYVKEKYTKDLGKKFKGLKKKYGWTLKNGSFSNAARCDYQVPKKTVWYTFQGDDSAGTWKMKNNSKCIYIYIKAGILVKGFKGKMKINKFVSCLYSKKIKASWSKGAEAYSWGEAAANIIFYAKNGQKYRLDVPLDGEKDNWISANDRVMLMRIR